MLQMGRIKPGAQGKYGCGRERLARHINELLRFGFRALRLPDKNVLNFLIKNISE